ncbi:hypothetical protein ABK040_013039 [Willaertia magna]
MSNARNVTISSPLPSFKDFCSLYERMVLMNNYSPLFMCNSMREFYERTATTQPKEEVKLQSFPLQMTTDYIYFSQITNVKEQQQQQQQLNKPNVLLNNNAIIKQSNLPTTTMVKPFIETKQQKERVISVASTVVKRGEKRLKERQQLPAGKALGKNNKKVKTAKFEVNEFFDFKAGVHSTQLKQKGCKYLTFNITKY